MVLHLYLFAVAFMKMANYGKVCAGTCNVVVLEFELADAECRAKYLAQTKALSLYKKHAHEFEYVITKCDVYDNLTAFVLPDWTKG